MVAHHFEILIYTLIRTIQRYLKLLIEKRGEYNLKTRLMFLDYEKSIGLYTQTDFI